MKKNVMNFFLILFCNIFFAQNNISQKWVGEYSLEFYRNRNYASTMYWEHSFLISKDSCVYEGSGFQFYTKYKCTLKENKDTLFVYSKTYIDGYQSYNQNELIMKMYKLKKNFYYTKTVTLKPEEALNKITKFGYRVYRK